MLAYREGRRTEICDLCGEEVMAGHAYTEGVNRYCSFDCMAEVNGASALVDELTGISRDDYPDLPDEQLLDMVRRDLDWGYGYDIGETSDPAEDDGSVIPALLAWKEYAALLETPPAEGSGVYITTPAMSPDRGWRAVVFKDGKPFGDEIRWPRLYSRSFREEVMDRCRKADIHRKEE